MLHHNRMPYRRLATLMLAAVMLVALISACGKKEEGTSGAGKGTVIATYKGGEVTDTEFDKYAAYAALMSPEKAMYMSIPQFKEQFIQQYIVTKEMVKNVSDEDKKAAETASATFKTQLEEAMKTQAELKKHMDDNNLSVNEAVAFFENDSAFQSYYTAKGEELKPSVTEAEIKAEFDKAPVDFNIVSVRHILIGTVDPQTQAELKTEEEALKLAKEVKAKLDNGGDWTALAKEYSTDTGSKDNGGLYEKQAAGGWVAEFKEAANTQEIGKVGEPVKTQFGYHVMKVENREVMTYEKLSKESKDKLIGTVINTKISDFLTAEQDKLEIKVTLPEEPSPTATGSPSALPSPVPDASPAAK
ncbi:peptidylprolyl isomerase [Cohnella sp.]|uniref:peptidylprolyl isomerase n=1 Tax=Cohnella sp. TaxID=1883426 RepID=UPI0035664CB9